MCEMKNSSIAPTILVDASTIADANIGNDASRRFLPVERSANKTLCPPKTRSAEIHCDPTLLRPHRHVHVSTSA
jgi:hypothetical protein